MTLRHILYSAIFIFVLPSDVVVRDRNTHIQVQRGNSSDRSRQRSLVQFPNLILVRAKSLSKAAGFPRKQG